MPSGELFDRSSQAEAREKFAAEQAKLKAECEAAAKEMAMERVKVIEATKIQLSTGDDAATRR